MTYLHNDHLGSVSVATTQAQTVAGQQEFDPWGKVRSGGISATSINFTGQRLDGTGLVYYHARLYDPLLGRFVSADSVVPNPADPQDLNRYSYVGNNPVNRTDPTGHNHACTGDIICSEASGEFSRGGGSGGGGGGGGAAAVVAVRIALVVVVAVGVNAAADAARQQAARQRTPVSSDTGGNTADPPAPTPSSGFDQEDAVRDVLARDYQQSYGESDSAVRTNLGIKGKVADFLGYNSRTGRWLIAESKGRDIPKAIQQIRNTMNGLLGKNTGASGRIDLRIYTNNAQYDKFFGPNGLGGYRLDVNGYLGYVDDVLGWTYEEVNGARILVQAAP